MTNLMQYSPIYSVAEIIINFGFGLYMPYYCFGYSKCVDTFHSGGNDEM
ncbi:MAG: hypothetical protein MSH47_02475 [Bacteroidales bacterium]|nr:hypothetical protein [Bacteroidales bacterium]